jgi:hypothetical protein
VSSVSPRPLTEPERRKLRVWRTIVKTSLALTWAGLAALLVLVFVPRAPGYLRAVAGGIAVESFLTAVLLGALGKCPACGGSFGFVSGRLAPERCPACGAALA